MAPALPRLDRTRRQIPAALRGSAGRGGQRPAGEAVEARLAHVGHARALEQAEPDPEGERVVAKAGGGADQCVVIVPGGVARAGRRRLHLQAKAGVALFGAPALQLGKGEQRRHHADLLQRLMRAVVAVERLVPFVHHRLGEIDDQPRPPLCFDRAEAPVVVAAGRLAQLAELAAGAVEADQRGHRAAPGGRQSATGGARPLDVAVELHGGPCRPGEAVGRELDDVEAERAHRSLGFPPDAPAAGGALALAQARRRGVDGAGGHTLTGVIVIVSR